MFSKAWAKATFERVISTGAAALLGVLTGDGATDNTDLNAKVYVSVVGVAMLVSLLKAVIASNTGDSASPSFANEVLAEETAPIAAPEDPNAPLR